MKNNNIYIRKGRKPITPHYSAHDGWDKLDAKKLTTRSTPPRQGARKLSRAAVPCHQSNSEQRPSPPSPTASTPHPATTGTDAVCRADRNECPASNGAREIEGSAYRVGRRHHPPRVLGTRKGGMGGCGSSRRHSLVTDRKPLPPPPWMESHLLQLDDDC